VQHGHAFLEPSCLLCASLKITQRGKHSNDPQCPNG
jgi:hypothetical protein